jgi:hypothetical protein
MAVKTLGTTGTTVLDAVAFASAAGSVTDADFATIRNAIKYDGVEGSRIFPDAFTRAGLLYIPRRGVLQVLPGDYVGVDATGWPILVSANAIASGATEWAHS